MDALNDIKRRIGICRGNRADVEACAKKIDEPNAEMQFLAANFFQNCDEFVEVYGLTDDKAAKEAAKGATTFAKKYTKAMLKPSSSKNHPSRLLEQFQSDAGKYLTVFERLEAMVAAPIDAAKRRQARIDRQEAWLRRKTKKGAH